MEMREGEVDDIRMLPKKAVSAENIEEEDEYNRDINTLLESSPDRDVEEDRQAIKKLMERERKAKYIYGKFGIQLLMRNNQTKKEMIPAMGEHIRLANEGVFQDAKVLLKNRKDSSLRYHY